MSKVSTRPPNHDDSGQAVSAKSDGLACETIGVDGGGAKRGEARKAMR